MSTPVSLVLGQVELSIVLNLVFGWDEVSVSSVGTLQAVKLQDAITFSACQLLLDLDVLKSEKEALVLRWLPSRGLIVTPGKSLVFHLCAIARLHGNNKRTRERRRSRQLIAACVDCVGVDGD